MPPLVLSSVYIRPKNYHDEFDECSWLGINDLEPVTTDTVYTAGLAGERAHLPIVLTRISSRVRLTLIWKKGAVNPRNSSTF